MAAPFLKKHSKHINITQSFFGVPLVPAGTKRLEKLCRAGNKQKSRPQRAALVSISVSLPIVPPSSPHIT